MSIENNKLMNLADGKVLYDDLRGRVDNNKNNIATDYANLTFPVSAGEYCIYNGEYYYATQTINNSEAWTAAHWQKTSVGEEITDVKSAFDIEDHPGSINILDPEAIETGCYYWTDGKHTSSSYNSSGLMPVAPGEKIYFTRGQQKVTQGRVFFDVRFLVAYGADKTTVKDSASNVVGSTGYTVPNDVAYVRISNGSYLGPNAPYSMVQKDSSLIDFVQYYAPYTTKILKAECNNRPYIESVIEPLAEITTEELTKSDIISATWSAGFMDTSGVVQTGGSYDTYHYTNKISVSPGDVIEFIDKSAMRCVTAYNGSTADSNKGYSGEIYSFTVPEGIDGVVVTAINTRFQDFTRTYTGVFPALTKEVDTLLNNAKSLAGGIRETFDIASDNHEIPISIEDNGKNSIQFIGRVTTFNGLIVGRGYNAQYGGYVKVTPTTFEYYMGTESSPRLSEAHGLTVNDYIAIRIDDDSENRHASFSVYTNGGSYTKTNQTWDVKKGVLSVRSVGSNVLSDCVLSYNCRGWNNPIHLYGDSYFGVYADKWPYYMISNNMLKNNFNAYPGRNSATALTSLLSVISKSAPKMIVWCLGMNDGDSGAVNTSWKSCVERIEEICEMKGIELVLATIPNVATVDNTYKNAYVRNSGHRYIDFASAVGASSDSSWFTGMLSNDGVHPSSLGAIALFNQAVSDAPELMN